MLADDVEAVLQRGSSIIRERIRFVVKRQGLPDEMFFTYTFSPIHDGHGGVGGVFQIAIDETARVVAERERRELQEREAKLLRDAKADAEECLARWHAVISNMTEGVILSDPDGNLLDWNRAALDMHGYSRAEDVRVQLSKIADDFELTDPDGGAIPFQEWPMSRLLRGDVMRNQKVHIHVRSTRLDLVLIYNGTLIRGDTGEIRLALLTLHDATENRRPRMADTPTLIKPGSRVIKLLDDSAHRTATDAAAATQAMLGSVNLDPSEREFCTSLGQHLVQEAIDAFLHSKEQGYQYDGSCIAASLAVAMLIVHDL